MWPYPWTHVGTASHLGHMDRVAATMPSQAHAGAAQEAPDTMTDSNTNRPESAALGRITRPHQCNIWDLNFDLSVRP